MVPKLLCSCSCRCWWLSRRTRTLLQESDWATDPKLVCTNQRSILRPLTKVFSRGTNINFQHSRMKKAPKTRTHTLCCRTAQQHVPRWYDYIGHDEMLRPKRRTTFQKFSLCADRSFLSRVYTSLFVRVCHNVSTNSYKFLFTSLHDFFQRPPLVSTDLFFATFGNITFLDWWIFSGLIEHWSHWKPALLHQAGTIPIPYCSCFPQYNCGNNKSTRNHLRSRYCARTAASPHAFANMKKLKITSTQSLHCRSC